MTPEQYAIEQVRTMADAIEPHEGWTNCLLIHPGSNALRLLEDSVPTLMPGSPIVFYHYDSNAQGAALNWAARGYIVAPQLADGCDTMAISWKLP